MKTLLALAGLFALNGSREVRRLPDSEGSIYPYVVSVQEGWHPTLGRVSCYFKMTPDPGDPHDRDKGLGYAYQVELGAADQLIWKTNGWYSFQTFLADDGRHLVRIGNWPRGNAPKAEDLAIAFYDAGVLTKSYSTLDLLKDPAAVEASVSHYSFLGGKPAFHDEDGNKDALFRLPLVDDSVCVFRVSDGSLKARK